MTTPTDGNEKTATDGVDRSKHVCGYTRVGLEEGDGTFGAGYTVYSAAWPLLKEYPGHVFQSGLFGTWMFAESENPEIDGVWFYSTIEGGLGWWRDTEYPTESPKFIMGAVAVGFCAWANGPGAGKGRDWNNPTGHYGIAQLSPYLLWPPDGVNMAQGVCGELLGYGYLPLPFAEPKEKTAGADVPTGNQCWTLFLNASNFKGPATMVLPYFFSGPTVDEPRLAGKFLDSRPNRQNRHHAMETQYIPWVQAEGSDGELYGRLAPTWLPTGEGDKSIVLHNTTAYNRSAMWDKVKAWFDGGEPADSRIDMDGSFVHEFKENMGMGWDTNWEGLKREDRIPLATSEFILPRRHGSYSLGYAPQGDLVKTVQVNGRELMQLPEYYRFVDDGKKGKWVAIPYADVPQGTGLEDVSFGCPEEPAPQVYVTPEEADSSWKTPGPVAGPFTAYPDDGSEVTYYWYRFADQPALQNADMTDAEREAMQTKVEMLHKHWTPEQEYIKPPEVGELAPIDSALLVQPPQGLEIGYVPIATRQGPRS